MSSTSAIQKIFAQVHSANGLAFPNTVSALMALGVTRYHIDYTAGTATTYTSQSSPESGEAEVEKVKIPSPAMSPRTSWSKDGVVKAIKRVQAGETKYAAFAQECVDSGVTGYLAFLSGKNVLYYGEKGEVHVEWFPGAGPRVD